MSKKIRFGLSVSEIQASIKEVKAYQTELNQKCEVFVHRLSEWGIQTAKANTGDYDKYISFSAEFEPNTDGCKAIMFATNTGIITSEWQTKEGVKTADVSPLLMVEFGSGLKAKNPAGVPGVGTGTFPGGTHGNEPGWWYMDLNDVWHYSTGVEPHMPMFKAAQTMKQQIVSVATEVFK